MFESMANFIRYRRLPFQKDGEHCIIEENESKVDEIGMAISSL
jgi:hypothetical protein